MKKCIVISDSFKGTLSSMEICEIARQSIPKFFPDCQVDTIPVADGGEGTVACFAEAIGAIPVSISVSGPFGEPIQAVYGRSGDTAIIEMAAAAGLTLVGGRQDPENATTYGVGQIICHAVENGCKEILLGLGGSCTNDGGCGCAAAVGVRFFDQDGAAFTPVGGTLDRIVHMDLTQAKHLLAGVKVTVMCDVDNPLYGPAGAAHVFAPQKGADWDMVQRLDRQLRSLDHFLEQELGCSVGQMPGAGAAGGMGAGCIAFLNAELKSGIEAVLDMVDFDHRLKGADLVITGEGRIDAQSVRGKVVSGIARRTQPCGIPLVVIAGSVAEDAYMAYDLGVTAMFGIDRTALAFSEYAGKTREYYQQTLEDIIRLVQAVAH